MNTNTVLLAATLGLVSLNASAVMGVRCNDSVATLGNAGYVSCQGALGGDIAAGQTDSATFDGFGTFNLVGSSNAAGFGPFTANPSGSISGVLNFDTPQTGYFVLGIQGGPTYSLYLFNGGLAGISALSFSTLGIADGDGNPGPALSQLALFAAPVPEPGSYALMLAGLAVVGSLSRRRRFVN